MEKNTSGTQKRVDGEESEDWKSVKWERKEEKEGRREEGRRED